MMKWTEPEDYGVNWRATGVHHRTGQPLHHGNSMPKPYTELTQEEYLRLAFCMTHSQTGEGNFRQVLDIGPGYWSLHIQHYPDYSLAVATCYDKPGMTEELGAAVEIPDGTKRSHYLRFFRIGCDHQYTEISHTRAHEELGVNTWGQFCHVYLCEKCGHHYSVDSSG